jgi:hypothetical protein
LVFSNGVKAELSEQEKFLIIENGDLFTLSVIIDSNVLNLIKHIENYEDILKKMELIQLNLLN